jgi:hypothetical protein
MFSWGCAEPEEMGLVLVEGVVKKELRVSLIGTAFESWLRWKG